MKLDASLGLKVGRQVTLLDELMGSVSKGTRVEEEASASEFPVSAHLRLQLGLVLPHEVISVLLICEVLLGSLHCGHLIVIDDLFRFLVTRSRPQFLINLLNSTSTTRHP